jgi:hypothetical protein
MLYLVWNAPNGYLVLWLGAEMYKFPPRPGYLLYFTACFGGATHFVQTKLSLYAFLSSDFGCNILRFGTVASHAAANNSCGGERLFLRTTK